MSALIAHLPALAPLRIVRGLVLLALVAGLTWFGHGGRLTFAVMTLMFVAGAVLVLARGFTQPVIAHGHAPITGPAGTPVVTGLLPFPVAMALANRHRGPLQPLPGLASSGDDRRLARGTLALTLIIVTGLTIGIAGLAVRLYVGIPRPNSTQIADVGNAAPAMVAPTRPRPATPGRAAEMPKRWPAAPGRVGW